MPLLPALAGRAGIVAAAADLGIPLSENWVPAFFTGIEEEEAFFYRPLRPAGGNDGQQRSTLIGVPLFFWTAKL